MTLEILNNSVGQFLRSAGSAEKGIPCGLPGLGVFEKRVPAIVEFVIYEPVVCLTLQGKKETRWGGLVNLTQPGDCFVVSHDLPITSRVMEASQNKPYRSLILKLDLALLRGLNIHLHKADADNCKARIVESSNADPSIVDAFTRYFSLVNDPVAAPVMAPLIFKELHFQILRLPQGSMLRRLVNVDSHASRIGRAVAHIRTNFRSPIVVAELSSIAGMSVSSFHAHFREITAMTPIQYQKELRLIEAQRLLAEEGRSVSLTAYDVGYESSTQFSREFSRRFGLSPRQQIQANEALAS